MFSNWKPLLFRHQSVLILIAAASVITFASGNSKWDTLQSDEFRQSFASIDARIYYYDANGILNINGKVPGTSSPIVLDFKQYSPTCSSNVYFNFLFTANLLDGKQNKKDLIRGTCNDGITICYEGQLSGSYMQPRFHVPNVNNSKLTKMCAKAVEGQYKVRGLNVAVKYFKGLRDEQIEGPGFDASYYKDGKYNHGGWHFFVVSSNFFSQEYYFPVPPEDGTMVMQLGGRKSLELRIMDGQGTDLPPVAFNYAQSQYGVKSIGQSPDLQNEQNSWQMSAGLWMLYLDFKAEYNAWQILSAVNPPNCNMKVQIRGNRMGACRSYFEDIAITEPVDAKMKMVYTSEVGTVQTQEHGEENIKELVENFMRENYEEMLKKSTNDSQSENTMTTDDTLQKIHETSKEIKKQKTFKVDMEVDWDRDIATGQRRQQQRQWERNTGQEPGEFEGDDLHAGIGGGYHKEETDITRDTTTNIQSTTDRKRNRKFSQLTKSHTMMENFKNSAGAAQSLSQSEFMSTAQSFRKRETVDIRISDIPPGTKVIIRQLMFECDGNVVKLPFIFLTNGSEPLKLSQNSLDGKFSMPLNPSWVNATNDGENIDENGNDSNNKNSGNSMGNEQKQGRNSVPLMDQQKQAEKNIKGEDGTELNHEQGNDNDELAQLIDQMRD